VVHSTWHTIPNIGEKIRDQSRKLKKILTGAGILLLALS